MYRHKKTSILISLFGVFLILLFSVPARADCSGHSPGQLEEELIRAVNGTAVVYTWWTNCLNPGFGAWQDGPVGSQNLPVVSAAIGLYRSPTGLMPGSQVSYTAWWSKYLKAQLRDLIVPDRPKLNFFHGTEAFSNTYDAPVVTTVVAVRYWSALNYNNANLTIRSAARELDPLARRFLRASWAIYGFSAGKSYAKTHYVDGRNPSPTPAPHTEYNPDAPKRPNGGYYYMGHFLALAGARSELSHAVADDRQPLFDRAIQFTPTRTNENFPQRDLLVLLQGKWTATGENLYALTDFDRSQFLTLIANGSNVNYFLPWLTGIRTARIFRILGWADVRASNMQGNPNYNTACMYGISFDSVSGQASFLFPWTDRNGGPAEGESRVEFGRITASNYPGAPPDHPYKAVQFAIPTAQPIFHVVLSPATDPYVDSTSVFNFPPVDP
jgi:hypothetical protein